MSLMKALYQFTVMQSNFKSKPHKPDSYRNDKANCITTTIHSL